MPDKSNVEALSKEQARELVSELLQAVSLVVGGPPHMPGNLTVTGTKATLLAFIDSLIGALEKKPAVSDSPLDIAAIRAKAASISFAPHAATTPIGQLIRTDIPALCDALSTAIAERDEAWEKLELPHEGLISRLKSQLASSGERLKDAEAKTDAMKMTLMPHIRDNERLFEQNTALAERLKEMEAAAQELVNVHPRGMASEGTRRKADAPFIGCVSRGKGTVNWRSDKLGDVLIAEHFAILPIGCPRTAQNYWLERVRVVNVYDQYGWTVRSVIPATGEPAEFWNTWDDNRMEP